MPTYQETLFFEDVAHSYGWSESYFSDQVDTFAARTHMDVLMVARAAVLVDLCQISAGRVSDVAIANDSLLSAQPPVPGDLASTILTAADPWSAFNVRMEAGPLNRGRKFFHGVLESTFSDNRTYNPANANAAAWTALFGVITGDYLLRIGPVGAYVYHAITECVPRRETSRKVGRPFDLLRGRAGTPASP